MISTEKIVWVVADQYVGNLNQCLGVAEALGLPYQIKRVNYNLFGRLPNVILGATLVHVPRAERLPLGPPSPDVVIAAGRRTVPVARAIKKASLRRSFLVQTMWPGYPVSDLDLILDEAARFCEDQLLPINQNGDGEGCKFESGKVTTPDGFKNAYKTFRFENQGRCI